MESVVEAGIEAAWKTSRIRCILLAFSPLLLWLLEGNVLYSINFTGEYPEKWTCLTAECESLKANKSTLSPCDIDNWAAGVDYRWIPLSGRTSFIIDFDLACASSLTRDVAAAMPMAGGILGLFAGSPLYDLAGPRRVLLCMEVVLLLSTIAGAFCHSYPLFLVLRFLQGVGVFINVNGSYVLVVHYLPARYRALMSGICLLFTALGYSLLVGTVTLISDWNETYYAAAAIVAVVHLPLIWVPESPKVCVNSGRREEAERALATFAKLNGVTFEGLSEAPAEEGGVKAAPTLDDTDIVKAPISGDAEVKASTMDQKSKRGRVIVQLRSLIANRVLLLETLAQVIIWLTTNMCYYGLNFGWDTLVPDTSTGYLIAMGVEVLAYLAFVPAVGRLGRRGYMAACYGLSAVTLAVGAATAGTPIGQAGWTVGSLASIISLFLVAGTFCGVYLWSGELAPATHTGTVVGICAMTGKFSGLFCPVLFGSLAKATGGQAASFGFLAVLSGVAAGASWMLVETEGRPIPGTPEEVTARRRGERRVAVVHKNPGAPQEGSEGSQESNLAPPDC